MYRTILFLGVLVTAAVGPIALYSVRNGGGTSFFQRLKNMTAASTESEPPPSNSLLPEEPSGRLSDPAIAALLEPPVKPKSMVVAPVVTSLPEIIRFDITPGFVTQRWPRVSCHLPDIEYDGLRVPIMTGTGPLDLHGSASYFFNRSHQLERISLQGYTDDPEPTVQFVTSTYRLKEYASNGPRLFLSYYKGQPLSMLRVQRAALGKENSMEIILEINAPIEGAKISKESMDYLTSLREAKLL